jgi:hypothetical protein
MESVDSDGVPVVMLVGETLAWQVLLRKVFVGETLVGKVLVDKSLREVVLVGKTFVVESFIPGMEFQDSSCSSAIVDKSVCTG